MKVRIISTRENDEEIALDESGRTLRTDDEGKTLWFGPLPFDVDRIEEIVIKYRHKTAEEMGPPPPYVGIKPPPQRVRVKPAIDAGRVPPKKDS